MLCKIKTAVSCVIKAGLLFEVLALVENDYCCHSGLINVRIMEI